MYAAGFDGFLTDPLGRDLGLSVDDYVWTTRQLLEAAKRCGSDDPKDIVGGGCKVISLLEGGYDVSPNTMGLARCVVAHVKTMKDNPL